MEVIQVLYEDEYCIAVEKPVNLLVHPYKESTDKISLMKLLKQQTGHYLYPIHRLDRPVSGIVLFGLASEFVRELQKEWGSRSTEKEYFTLCRRQLTEPGTFSFDLSDENKVKKKAITHYEPIEIFQDYTFLNLKIETGRKHQIRRHFSRRVYNIVGDTAYGKGQTNNFFRNELNFHRIFLHAHKLSFFHPFMQKKILIESALPMECKNVLATLREKQIH